jgi:hypothetical protein
MPLARVQFLSVVHVRAAGNRQPPSTRFTQLTVACAVSPIPPASLMLLCSRPVLRSALLAGSRSPTRFYTPPLLGLRSTPSPSGKLLMLLQLASSSYVCGAGGGQPLRPGSHPRPRFRLRSPALSGKLLMLLALARPARAASSPCPPTGQPEASPQPIPLTLKGKSGC